MITINVVVEYCQYQFIVVVVVTIQQAPYVLFVLGGGGGKGAFIKISLAITRTDSPRTVIIVICRRRRRYSFFCPSLQFHLFKIYFFIPNLKT